MNRKPCAGLLAEVARAVEAVVRERLARGRLVAQVAGHHVRAADLDLLVADADLDLSDYGRPARHGALLRRRVARRVGDQRLHLRGAVALVERDPARVAGVDQRARLEVERGEAGLAQLARRMLEQPPDHLVRAGGVRDAVPLDQLARPLRVELRQQHVLAAGGQRARERAEAEHAAQREQAQHDGVVRAVAERVRDRGGVGVDAALGVDDELRRAGRAGRREHHPGRVGALRSGPSYVSSPRREHAVQRSVDLLQLVAQPIRHDERRRLRAAQDVLDLARLEARVDRDAQRAHAARGVGRVDPLLPVLQPDRHPHSGSLAVDLEAAAGHAAGVELAAVGAHALLQAHELVVLAARPPPRVAHLQRQRAVAPGDAHARGRAARVAVHVRQRLLDDPVRRQVEPGRDAPAGGPRRGS